MGWGSTTLDAASVGNGGEATNTVSERYCLYANDITWVANIQFVVADVLCKCHLRMSEPDS